MRSTNPYLKLLSNTVAISVGKVVSKLMVFLLLPLITAVLSTPEYSLADLVQHFSSFLIPLACVELSRAVLRFAADKSEDRKKVISSAILAQIYASAAFLILSPLLFLVPVLKGYGWLVILYVLCANYQSLFAQYVMACQKTALFTLQNIVNTVLTLAFCLTFLLGFKAGVTGYVMATVLANLLTSVLLFFAGGIWRDIRFRLVDRSLIFRMIRFSAPFVFTTVFWLITDLSDRLFIIGMIGEDVNGLYAAAGRIPMILVLLASAFNEAWQLSSILSSENTEECRSMFENVNRSLVALSFIGCSFLILLAQPISYVMYSEAFRPSWIYIPILLLSTVFSTFNEFLGSVYHLKLKSILSLITAGAGAILNLVLNYFMIRAWGAIGAAIATAVTYMFVWILRAISVRRMLPFPMGELRILINTLIVTGQIVLLLTGVLGTWTYPVQFLFAALITGINLRSMIRLVKPYLRRFFKKGKTDPDDPADGNIEKP